MGRARLLEGGERDYCRLRALYIYKMNYEIFLRSIRAVPNNPNYETTRNPLDSTRLREIPWTLRDYFKIEPYEKSPGLYWTTADLNDSNVVRVALQLQLRNLRTHCRTRARAHARVRFYKK